jgi:hypothetical protein
MIVLAADFQEFSTEADADSALTDAVHALVKAENEECKNWESLPILEVIDTEVGPITVREGPLFGRRYFYTAANGTQMGSNNLSMLYTTMAIRGCYTSKQADGDAALLNEQEDVGPLWMSIKESPTA